MASVTTIMGPGSGNKDLEDCPPASHFELSVAELMDAVRDPASTAKRLGLGLGVKAIHLSYTTEQQQRDGMPPGWRCVMFNGQWYCVYSPQY